MERAIIHTLFVWDPVVKRKVALQPGVILRSCRIARYAQRSTYYVEFEAEGRTYQSPLHEFQPRTECVPGETEPSLWAAESVLVHSR